MTKVYDATTAAPAGFTPSYNVTGFVSGDTAASLTNSGSAYNSAHVLAADTLTVSGIAISGITGSLSSAASDYSINSSADVAPTSHRNSYSATLSNTGVTKVYDATTAAPAGFTPTYSFTGLVSGDSSAVISNSGSAYDSAHVVGATQVTVSGLSLSSITGSNSSLSSDYNFTPTSLSVCCNDHTESINSVSLTNTGVTKVYDATTAAPAGFTPSYNVTGFVSGDTAASLTNSGSAYNSAHVLAADTLTVSGIAISGITGSLSSAASDYSINSSADVSASITPKSLSATLSNTGVTKVYDATTAAPAGFTPTYSFTGLVSGDSSAVISNSGSAYDSAHVVGATQVTVSGLSLSSITGSNSSLSSDYNFTPTSLSVAATITPKALTASLSNTGVTKVYDATTAAPAGFTPSYNVTGFVSGDTAASLTNSGSAYNSAHVLAADTLTVSGIAISGITGSLSSAASDYSINSSANVAATITREILERQLKQHRRHEGL